MICCRGTADEAMAAMRRMMSQAEVDGERDEDAAVSGSRGDVRLSGLHDRPVLLAADGTVLHRDAPVGEEDRAPSGRDPRDRPTAVGCWTEVEDRVARLNRLLLGWSNYFCLGPVSRAYRAVDRHVRQSASPVALRQAQGEDPGDVTVPRSVPVRRVGADPPERTDEELPVGESMSSCPRAGCGKTACPVR